MRLPAPLPPEVVAEAREIVEGCDPYFGEHKTADLAERLIVRVAAALARHDAAVAADAARGSKLERNLSTPESRDWWRKVDEAAANAPEYPGHCQSCDRLRARLERVVAYAEGFKTSHRTTLSTIMDGVLRLARGEQP